MGVCAQYAKAGLLPEPGKKIKQKVKELMDAVTPVAGSAQVVGEEGVHRVKAGQQREELVC